MTEDSIEIHFPGVIKTFVPSMSTDLGRGHEKKSVVSGRLDDSEVSLVRKEPLNLDLTKNWQEDPVGFVIHVSQAFRDAGLPVVEVGYSESGGKKEACWMPNITADGSRLYDSGVLIDEDERTRCVDNLDKVFLGIWNSPDGFKRLKEEADTLVEIACQNKLQLPPDEAFSLKVNPDGTWNPIILDLTAARDESPLNEEELYSANSEAVDISFSNLSNIDKLLQEKSSFT
jgi:hypothetical protein